MNKKIIKIKYKKKIKNITENINDYEIIFNKPIKASKLIN